MTLTQTRLKELLRYDPETGDFTWLVSRGRSPAGSRAESPDSKGYIRIGIDGFLHYSHRLAFLYMTGAPPPAEVDHINRDRGDNRWTNLRLATSRDNKGNAGVRSDNTSGHRGVSWDKRSGEWQAYGRRTGRKIHLGYFDRLEEAASAAQKWRAESFKDFAA